MTKNTKKNNANKISERECSTDFSDSENMRFRAIIKSSPIAKNELHEFTIKGRDGEDNHLTFDEVEDEAFKFLEKKYPNEFYPKSDIVGLEIKDGDKWYPVISESDADKIKKTENDKSVIKMLVLPDALYTLTPEAKMYMTLIGNKILPKSAKFNFKEMHKIIKELEK